jgi:hypothetical protein
LSRALLLSLVGLPCAACALVGYDFDGYREAPAAAGAPSQDAISMSEADAAQAGDAPLVASTFSAGGAAQELGEAGRGGQAGQGVSPPCEPRGCFEQGAECGPLADDGCGSQLHCGVCFWWFEVCEKNSCIIPE